jgi:hypothetical protein
MVDWYERSFEERLAGLKEEKHSLQQDISEAVDGNNAHICYLQGENERLATLFGQVSNI